MILTPKKFSLFKDWNIDMILYTKELHSKYPMISLEKIIKPRKEKTKAKDVPKDRLVVNKIRFIDGHIFFKDRIIKNDMNKSCINDLLVSNINFEKGAFAVNVWGDLYASTDYTSYIIDTTVTKPEYLFLSLRCRSFMEYVASVKPKGMKTRARYEFIKNFEIPVPSIADQEAILRTYHETLDKAEKNILSGNDFGANLLYDIQSKVSDLKQETLKKSENNTIMQIVPFASTRRWEVEYIQKEGRLENIYNSFNYANYCIGDLQKESLFGLSVKASTEMKKGMIPVLRMSNVVNGEIDFSELKYLPKQCAVTDKEPDKWILKPGDFLITRTNGSKDLVGKAAVFNSTEIYTYASYLIRYRFDTTKVLPEYVNIMFMTPLVREQIAVMRRQGGGQYNLNSDEIGAIRIPVPSIPMQKEIIKNYNDTKGGANVYYKKAKKYKEEAQIEFESEIFS
ncbi:MAG: restriction endonuclease subunit S [Bacteroidales bacterium]|nr:restriction endonuclease subunit S [Lachnoclostridium sp.]MCM1385548.1 restriction endonuclease subunit S [Lachnoclostridium sp.]MCM1465476.1 restriction endonuclease subunit S [Bacteroidales bacterium]